MAGVAQLDDFDQQLYKVTKGEQGQDGNVFPIVRGNVACGCGAGDATEEVEKVGSPSERCLQSRPAIRRSRSSGTPLQLKCFKLDPCSI